MKRILLVSAAVVLTLTLSAAAFTVYQKTATPSQTKFIMDGKEVTFDTAYTIENSNYIQLRSVAQALSGTKSQFNVYWDDALKQAVIETGVPYTGVGPTTQKAVEPNLSTTPMPTETTKKSYEPGAPVAVGDAEVTVTKIFTTSSVNGGNIAIARNGEVFYGITLTVLTPNQPYSGRFWYPNDFLSYILTTDGVRYEEPFSDGKDKVYPNQKGNVTIYFTIEQGDTIASIVVSDGKGNNETVSVQ